MNEREKNIQNKLVSNARAIISNHVTIPLGVQIMTNLIFRIRNTNLITKIDFQVFEDYYSSTTHYAIGTERLQYNFEYLKQQDIGLDKLTALYKERILFKCFEIIKEFSDKE